MALVDTVTDYFRNVIRGGKDIIKRDVVFESLEFLVSAATAYAGGIMGYEYAGTATSTIIGTGIGYLVGHLIFLPFDIYKGAKNLIEGAKVALGQPVNSAGHA